jgi:hypothetical protein
MSPAALDAAEVASLMLNQTAIRLAVTVAAAMQRDGYRLECAEPEETVEHVSCSRPVRSTEPQRSDDPWLKLIDDLRRQHDAESTP